MTLLLPKEEIHWERAVEQLVQQHHTDLQRLWRRVPIGPQAVGIPLMGISFPGDPDEFGSQATFGPYSGTVSQTLDTGGTITGAPQILLPNGDQSFSPTWDGTFGWRDSAGVTCIPGGSSFSAIAKDPVNANDATYVECECDLSAFGDYGVALFGLESGEDRHRDDSHIIRIRHQRESTFSGGVEVRIRQNGTLIQGFSCTVGTSIASESFALTNASSITNYNLLQIELVLLSVGGQGWVRFFGAHLEIP